MSTQVGTGTPRRSAAASSMLPWIQWPFRRTRWREDRRGDCRPHGWRGTFSRWNSMR